MIKITTGEVDKKTKRLISIATPYCYHQPFSVFISKCC